VAEGERLRRVKVNTVRNQGEDSFVDEGLNPGDLVVLTRLVDPAPGILLEYEMPEAAAGVLPPEKEDSSPSADANLGQTMDTAS